MIASTSHAPTKSASGKGSPAKDSASNGSQPGQSLSKKTSAGTKAAKQQGRIKKDPVKTVATKASDHLCQLKLEELLAEPIEFIAHDSFDDPQVIKALLADENDAPELDEAEAEARGKRKVPRGLPAYLASLYDTTLLSKEEEAELFRRMNFLKAHAAKLLAQVDRQAPTFEDLDQIERLASRATEIRNHIIRCNLRLVVSIAKKYVDPTTSFDELVSDGNESLMRAVEKFDFSRGFRFSTYATWAIRRNFFRQISDKRRRRHRFVNVDEEAFESAREPVEPQAELTENEYVRLRASMARILDQLNDRERNIINLRFGIEDGIKPHTLQQIGNELGVSKERVRQIEGRALGKLRAMAEEERIEPPAEV